MKPDEMARRILLAEKRKSSDEWMFLLDTRTMLRNAHDSIVANLERVVGRMAELDRQFEEEKDG